MHLSEKFGATWRIIEHDGFKIDKKIDLGTLEDTPFSILDQISKGIVGFSHAFQELKPDIILLLGDRYEILAAAQTALILNIPIAHVHGGELTEGAFDDAIRHSVTKMSSIHFASTEKYRTRIIQLGERPNTVFNVGAPGLENFLKLKLLNKEQLEKHLNFKLLEKNFLITYHPVTLANEDGMHELMSVLEKYSDCGQIITMPNSDPGHSAIVAKWKKYSHNKKNVYLVKNLGQIRYLSAMKVCDVVIGNSSSGIIEAPFCATPTVNIGLRQKGREMAKSIINVEEINENNISNAIEEALKTNYSPSNLYGDGNTSKHICEILSNLNLEKTYKSFYDL